MHGPAQESSAVARGPFGRPTPLPPQDPVERAVPKARLLDWLTGDPEGRAAAEAALARLTARALILPGNSTKVAVPALFHQELAALQGLGRPADTLLSTAFNAAEIHRINDGLHLPGARTRDDAQLQITAFLSDQQQLRTMLAQAPAEAATLLGAMTEGSPHLRAQRFTTKYGYYAGPDSKFLFRSGSSGDPGVDWLAERGMLIPVGTDLVELPYEVGHALRDDDTRPVFQVTAPPINSLVPLPRAAEGEAQVAAATAVSRMELLLRATATKPLAVRKAGGIAVRETKRLARTINASEPHTRLWLDLASNADLIAPHRDETPAPRGRSRRPGPAAGARMLPTGHYDQWLAASPANRLLPLLITWTVTPEVFSHWPDPDDTPVALVSPHDPLAVPLRHATLAALAHLPTGHGLALGPRGEPTEQAMNQLIASAGWFRSMVSRLGADAGSRLLATLHEAGLLGAVAHGALTPVGHALLALLDAGAARHFPAVPGVGAAADLTGHPLLAARVRTLREALSQLLPPPRTTARFQADLTATVTGAASPELTDLLSGVADRESEGHAVVWRITPAGLRRALDGGLDADDLTRRLAAVSEGGSALPQTLEYTIKDTARTHGRMRVVRSACCIRSDDESLVLELSQARALTKLGLRRIAPTVLISTAGPDPTLAALRAAGYAPVLEAETGTTVIERAPEERAEGTMPRLAEARRHHGPGPQTAGALATKLLADRKPGPAQQLSLGER
jgi:hypothetical protein